MLVVIKKPGRGRPLFHPLVIRVSIFCRSLILKKYIHLISSIVTVVLFLTSWTAFLC